MAVLVWDKPGEHWYETGCDKGVLFVQEDTGVYGNGVAWNGLTGVTESPDGAEPTDLYANNAKYASLRSAETFGGTIKAYTYPDAFNACDGKKALAKGVTVAQQNRSSFGLTYRNLVGNDTSSDSDDAYIIHLVYGATVKPSEKERNTVNDSPDANEFSWEFDTTPVAIPNMKPTSHIEIDSRTATKEKLKALEDKIYGTAEAEPTLPTPSEVMEMFKEV